MDTTTPAPPSPQGKSPLFIVAIIAITVVVTLVLVAGITVIVLAAKKLNDKPTIVMGGWLYDGKLKAAGDTSGFAISLKPGEKVKPKEDHFFISDPKLQVFQGVLRLTNKTDEPDAKEDYIASAHKIAAAYDYTTSETLTFQTESANVTRFIVHDFPQDKFHFNNTIDVAERNNGMVTLTFAITPVRLPLSNIPDATYISTRPAD